MVDIDNIIHDTIQLHEEIHYCCDFNYTPISHAIAVERELYTDIKTKKTVKGIFILD